MDLYHCFCQEIQKYLDNEQLLYVVQPDHYYHLEYQIYISESQKFLLLELLERDCLIKDLFGGVTRRNFAGTNLNIRRILFLLLSSPWSILNRSALIPDIPFPEPRFVHGYCILIFDPGNAFVAGDVTFILFFFSDRGFLAAGGEAFLPFF